MQRGLGQRGAVLPLVAISLTVLLGFGGMSVNVGYWQYQQREQQNAADSAAIGGAQALDAAGCPGSAAALAAADTDAASSGGYTSSQVTVNNPPASGAYAGNNCAVSVTIKGSKPSFFARLFGITPTVSETTTATAELVSTNSACIYLLSTTAVSTFSGSNVSAPGCGILINNTATFSGSHTVNAQSIGYGGTPPTVSGTTFTGATPAPMLQAPNPCPEIPGCASLASTPPSTSSCQTLSQSNMNPTISPGCYNSLVVGSCGTVTLEPGVYVINGTSDFSNSRFVGTGVTFYVTASGTAPDFSSAVSATISPPTTGTYDGVLYYQVPSNTTAPNLSGSSLHFSGLVYAPGATGVNFNGAQGDYTMLVLGSANLNSSSGYTFGTPPAGSTLVQNVVLTQ